MNPSYMMSSLALFLISAILLVSFNNVDGHGYMIWPMARNAWKPANYCAHCMNGAGGTRTGARQALYGNSTAYGIEASSFPHEALLQQGFKSAGGLVLEPNGIAVRHGVCGDPSQNDPDGSNLYNQALSRYPVQAVFLAGGEIEIEVILTAHHRGHFEFFLCDTEGLSDEATLHQECFNQYPLTRAYKATDYSPVDPNYPDRFYVPPACYKEHTDQSGVSTGALPTGHRQKVTYYLPNKVSKRMVLQWYYWTANSCLPIGYTPDFFGSIPNKACDEDWVNFSLVPCAQSYPEEFWNCADIEVTDDASRVTPKNGPTTIAPPSTGPSQPSTVEPSQPSTGTPPANTQPPSIDVHWDKDWSLGGRWVQSKNQWMIVCGCKHVHWPTAHTTQQSCVNAWIQTDPLCITTEE